MKNNLTKQPKCPYCHCVIDIIEEYNLEGNCELLTSCPECEKPITIIQTVKYVVKPTE